MKFEFRPAIWDWNYALQKALQNLDIGLLIDRQFGVNHDSVASKTHCVWERLSSRDSLNCDLLIAAGKPLPHNNT
jgi:hypothetical protein